MSAGPNLLVDMDQGSESTGVQSTGIPEVLSSGHLSYDKVN